MHNNTCTHTHTHTKMVESCILLSEVLRAFKHIHAHMHTYIHTHIHTYIHAHQYDRKLHPGTCTHTYIHTYMHASMIESYILLSEVLRAFKHGHDLPQWFQNFARRFAADSRNFLYLDLPTKGGVLANNCQDFHADVGVTHYVGAVVSGTLCSWLSFIYTCIYTC
jgi:hypothetical protein